MTRPDLLRDVDEFLSKRSKGSAWDWRVAADWIAEADTLLRECREALAAADREVAFWRRAAGGDAADVEITATERAAHADPKEKP